MDVQTSGTTIPGYTIIRHIGLGGSAEVFLAVQENLNRRVALKLVKGTLTSEAKFGERFKREGRIIAQFNHPCIIPVYDIGEYDGQFYMAMEYLSGGDLRFNASQLTLSDLLRVISQITQALQVAHDRGFVHRDIKPANILFRNSNEAVLTDFGISRPAESLTQMTVTGTILGTPAYMSPEQINGNTLDGRADLYSLGVTLFEMLTGYQPYRGESLMSVAVQHAHAAIPRLPKASALLQNLLDRLMAKQPQDRISDAQTLQLELEKLLDLNKNLNAPLTSLWPDKAPQIESSSNFFANAEGIHTTGRKTGKTLLITVTAALGLIIASGATTWYVINKPQAIDSSTLTSSRNDTEPSVQIDDAAVLQLPVQEPPAWQESLAQANQMFEQGQLVTPEGGNALALYRQVLQQDKDNVMAKNGEQNILQSLLLEVEKLILNESLDKASQQLAVLKNLWPDREQLQQLENKIAQTRQLIQAGKLALQKATEQREIENNLQAATAAMIAGNYLKPHKENALFFFKKTLSLQPGNKTAKRGLEQISEALILQIQSGLSGNNFELAETLLEDLRSVDSKHPQLQSTTDAIATARSAYLEQQNEQKRVAELQKAIDRLSNSVSQWSQSNESLDAQSSYGNQLVAEISRLLANHSENVKLRALFDSVKQRLDGLSAQRQKALSTQQENQAVRKPVVGGF